MARWQLMLGADEIARLEEYVPHDVEGHYLRDATGSGERAVDDREFKLAVVQLKEPVDAHAGRAVVIAAGFQVPAGQFSSTPFSVHSARPGRGWPSEGASTGVDGPRTWRQVPLDRMEP